MLRDKFFSGKKTISYHPEISSEVLDALHQMGVNWVHGSKSAILAVLLETPIPKALMPSGWLLDHEKTLFSDKFYTLCGTRDTGTLNAISGQRKGQVNYEHLSGVDCTRVGVELAASYAIRNDGSDALSDSEALENFIGTFLKVLEEVDKEVPANAQKGQIKYAMKSCVMLLQSIMIMWPEWKDHKIRLVDALNNAKTRNYSEQLYPTSLEIIFKYIDKMLIKIEKNLLPFEVTDEFRNKTRYAFPIVFAAEVDPNKLNKVKGMPGERAHKGMVELEQVKAILVQEQHKEELQSMLNKLGYENKITVLTFEVVKKEFTDYSRDLPNFTIEGSSQSYSNENSMDDDKKDDLDDEQDDRVSPRTKY